MINEEITQKECNLAARVGSLSYNELKKALEKLIADLEQRKNAAHTNSTTPGKNKTPELKHGKQTLTGR